MTPLPRAATLACAIGGAVGSVARYEASLHFTNDQFPWTTLLVNCSGAFLLGVLGTLFALRWTGRDALTVGVCTGVLGGFTTFSALCVEVVDLVRHDHAGTAAAYLVASAVIGLLAAAAGIAVARSVAAATPTAT